MRVFIFLLSVLTTFGIEAQEWTKYYGAGQHPEPRYCIEGYDRGLYLAGRIQGKFGWIIKTDVNGNVLWDLKVGDGIRATSIRSIEHTADNGLIVCGTTHLTNTSKADPYILKLNPCGESEWCQIIENDATEDIAIRVDELACGGYVMVAGFYSPSPINRTKIFKFSSNGNPDWVKTLYNPANVYNEEIRAMHTDSTSILLTGCCYYPDWLRPYFIKTDTSGNELWTLVYSQNTGLGHVGDAWSSVRDSHGGYYSVGYRGGSPELLKVSSDGLELLSVDLFPTAQSGSSRTVAIINDTSCYMDASWSPDGIVSYFSLVRTDTLGNIKQIKYLNDPEHSGPACLATTQDKKLLLMGLNTDVPGNRIFLHKFNTLPEYDSVYQGVFAYDTLCPVPIVSHTVPLSCSVVLSSGEMSSEPTRNNLTIFPNPAAGKITVILPESIQTLQQHGGFSSETVFYKWSSVWLTVQGMDGKTIFQRKVNSDERIFDLTVDNWRSGTYTFALVKDGRILLDKKVVVL